MVIRSKPTYAVLTNLYDTIRDIIKDDESYFTDEEIAEKKENESNIFLKKGQ